MKHHIYPPALYIIGAILILFFVAGGTNMNNDSEEIFSDRDVIEELGPHPLRFPQVSIRMEKYLLPAVSTGPLDPGWSPDGRWITYSMRGDIWKVPVKGGEAVALTEGPGYYFEPSWSPDGNSIAFTKDDGNKLLIGIVSSDGKSERLVVTNSEINIEPVWSPDGEQLYFVSDRGRGLSIFRMDVAGGNVTPVVAGSGNQIQPAVSPDGKKLAYVAPVRGKPGSGGIWIKSLPSGKPELVHYEETRYRTAPDWTPDGHSIVYVSEIAGNNNIGIIPAAGGPPIWLTHDEMNEYSPTVNPEGKQILFTSNQDGPTRMFTMAVGGGAVNSWKEVPITELEPKQPLGKVQLRVVGPDGQPVPARVYLKASDGRAYTPDKGFHRVVSVGEHHYFHTDGTDTITVPAGKANIESVKGFEYHPAQLSLEVPEDDMAEATLKLERLADSPARGWYSGETHAHDLHGGRFGLTHEDFFKQLQAEDLHVTNALIHMDGTRVMGRWEDLTGEPHPLSTDKHFLQYGEEFRGSRGHVGLLGIKEFIMPLVGGERGTAYSSEVINAHYIEEAEAQGGIGGFMHPYGSKVIEPSDGSFSEIPVDVALGKGSFYDVLNIPYDAFANVGMYYRLLNCGFRLSATGGSDPFADVWRDPPTGTTRTYAQVRGPLSVQSWLDAVKAGRTFASNGPLIFVSVEGKGPGSEIRLTGQETATLRIEGEVASIAPLEMVEVILNGNVVQSIDVRDRGTTFDFSVPINVEDNGWIAIRTFGFHYKYVTDSYTFAQTTPVYVLRNGRRYISSEDAGFLHDVVEAFWQSVQNRARWHSDREKLQYRDAVEQARAVYKAIAEGNYSFEE